jgi:ribose transport system permease protein
MLTDGGNPVYLPPNGVPQAFHFLGHGTLAGVPTPLIIAFGIAIAAAIVLGRSRFGRVVLATGIQPSVVRYSGPSVRAHIAVVFIAVGVIAAAAGLILTATVSVYIPSSGNAFLLNAIGATFIGTTFSPLGRPNIVGTLLGVLLLSVVANGLLLSGLNFYWQQVGTGTLIFAVLALSFGSRRG